MARSWLSLLLAGALGALLGCGLTARLMTAPQVSSLVEGHSSAAMEGGARFTTLSIEHGAHAEKGAEPGEEEEEGEQEGEQEDEQEDEQEEEQEGEEFGGIFAMEEVDPLVISTLLIGLIVVTIGYEQAVDLLQEHVFYTGIGKLLLGKMVRELTIPRTP